MRKHERNLLLADIREKTTKCLESRKNANDLISIISQLQGDEEKVILVAVRSVNKVFSHFLEVEEMYMDRDVKKTDTDITKEEHYKLWLRERYTDVTGILTGMLETAAPNIQSLCLSTVMKFISKEGRHPLNKVAEGKTSFPIKLCKRVVDVLLSDILANDSLVKDFQEYLEFVDVRYHTLSHIQHLCQHATKQEMTNTLLTNMFAVLENINLKTGKGCMKKFLGNPPEETHKITKPLEHKKLFSSTWIEFLKLKLPTSLYKRVLVMLHEKVMPHMDNPLLLSDFLTESYSIGGAFSLLALNGLFILVHKYNLNYPDFYEKLYALFEPSIFHVKYKSRFFHLCDLFLSSTHLPAYLVAAFAKRLARISLTAPPPSMLIVIPLIYNLINRHPTCKQLIDRPDMDFEYNNDPYDPLEPNPAKCGALDSCLWELKTLQHHYHPQVVRQARKIDQDLPALETDISAFLDVTADDLFDKDVSKKLKMAAVTFLPPSGLLGNKEDKLKLCWTL